jgi:serine/threonine-protein kinase
MEVDASEDQAARARARVGKVLDKKWRLEALLGIGGMAAVYLAVPRHGKRMAVKILHAELSVGGDVKERLFREASTANKVGHPGAPSIICDGESDGMVYLLMDLIEGETLAHRAARQGGRLQVAEVLAATSLLLDVLAAAHDKLIVHRDIKPENLMITYDSTIKVLDFGIATVHERFEAQGITRTGAVPGTIAFMPPEQARGQKADIDARTDLWAVGATMFYLLSGRTVHVADTTNLHLLAAMTMPAPSLHEVAPGVPDVVRALVDRSLSFTREKRFPDARTMQAAVRAAYAAVEREEELSQETVTRVLRFDEVRVESAGHARLVGGARRQNALKRDSIVDVNEPGASGAVTSGLSRLQPQRVRTQTAAARTAGPSQPDGNAGIPRGIPRWVQGVILMLVVLGAVIWGGVAASVFGRDSTSAAPPLPTTIAGATTQPLAPAPPPAASAPVKPSASAAPSAIASGAVPQVSATVGHPPSPRPTATRVVPPVPEPVPEPAPVDTETESEPVAPAPEPIAIPSVTNKPGKEDPGFLTIVCNPYCDDVLDQGRSLGPSPIVHLSVKPGQHRITLKKGTSTKVISVIVESGQVAAQRVSMK